MRFHLSPRYVDRQDCGNARPIFPSGKISTDKAVTAAGVSRCRKPKPILALESKGTAHRWLDLGMVCLISLGLAGCGPRLAPVHGRVTYKGQPLPDATVVFISVHGQIATGVTDAKGQFALRTARNQARRWESTKLP